MILPICGCRPPDGIASVWKKRRQVAGYLDLGVQGRQREIVPLGKLISPELNSHLGPGSLQKPNKDKRSVSWYANRTYGFGYAGIGYVGMAYAKAAGVKAVSVDDTDANEETVRSKKYPYSRATYYYTNGDATGIVKKFVDFTVSDEGQKIAVQVGFVPIK